VRGRYEHVDRIRISLARYRNGVRTPYSDSAVINSEHIKNRWFLENASEIANCPGFERVRVTMVQQQAKLESISSFLQPSPGVRRGEPHRCDQALKFPATSAGIEPWRSHPRCPALTYSPSGSSWTACSRPSYSTATKALPSAIFQQGHSPHPPDGAAPVSYSVGTRYGSAIILNSRPRSARECRNKSCAPRLRLPRVSWRMTRGILPQRVFFSDVHPFDHGWDAVPR